MRRLTTEDDETDNSERPAGKRPPRDVRVARTPVGLGVFSQRRYQADDMVGEIEGAVVDDWDYSSDYCMDMGDSRCLEPGPPFRYVNHSCQPNCRFQWFDISSAEGAVPRRRIFLLAQTAIERGDELTIDYGWPASMAIPCRCQAINCRGWIVAEEDLAKMPPSAAL